MGAREDMTMRWRTEHAAGVVSSESRRWAAPPPDWEEPDSTKFEYCRKYGVVFDSAVKLKVHCGRCEVTEWVAPQGVDRRRKRWELVRFGQCSKHENVSRGSVRANRTCIKCGVYIE